jgi:hypothetical protein
MTSLQGQNQFAWPHTLLAGLPQAAGQALQKRQRSVSCYKHTHKRSFFFNGRRKYACKCSLTIAWIENRPCSKRSCTEASIIIGPHAGAEIDLHLLLTFNPTKQVVRIKGVARHAHKGTMEPNGEQQNLFGTEGILLCSLQ